jgi:hypothetical protein
MDSYRRCVIQFVWKVPDVWLVWKRRYCDECLQRTTVFGVRGSKSVSAALRTLHAPVVHQKLRAQTQVPSGSNGAV